MKTREEYQESEKARRMSEKVTVTEIIASLLNGQKKQMVNQIKEYDEYDFFADFKDYLTNSLYVSAYNTEEAYKLFTDCVISYHRIKNR